MAWDALGRGSCSAGRIALSLHISGSWARVTADGEEHSTTWRLRCTVLPSPAQAQNTQPKRKHFAGGHHFWSKPRAPLVCISSWLHPASWLHLKLWAYTEAVRDDICLQLETLCTTGCGQKSKEESSNKLFFGSAICLLAFIQAQLFYPIKRNSFIPQISST